jgi:hypothetical protein
MHLAKRYLQNFRPRQWVPLSRVFLCDRGMIVNHDASPDLAGHPVRVLRSERTLVTAHGNSLRALVMVLDRLGPKEIIAREPATGVPLIYHLNGDAAVANGIDLAA